MPRACPVRTSRSPAIAFIAFGACLRSERRPAPGEWTEPAAKALLRRDEKHHPRGTTQKCK